jgi:hypothetical protein
VRERKRDMERKRVREREVVNFLRASDYPFSLINGSIKTTLKLKRDA